MQTPAEAGTKAGAIAERLICADRSKEYQNRLSRAIIRYTIDANLVVQLFAIAERAS